MPKLKIDVPKVRYLPKTVEAWMCYTATGEMRANMYRQGGYIDQYCGWQIAWSTNQKQYILKQAEPTRRPQEIRFTVKSDAYKFARDNAIHVSSQEKAS